MRGETWATTGSIPSFEERWGDDPPIVSEQGEEGIPYRVWEVEPGFLVLTIVLRAPRNIGDSGPALIATDCGGNGFNGKGAAHRNSVPALTAASLQAFVAEHARSSELHASLTQLAGLVLPPLAALDFPGLTIDPATREVQFGGRDVELTRREFDLFYFLARHPRHVFTRSQLLDYVWGWGFFGDEETVTVHVSRLRRKLGHGQKNLDLIQTVRGIGYSFEPPNRGV